MAKGREFEIKFVVDSRDAERVIHHPLLVDGLPRRKQTRLISTYFDTPDGALRDRRVSLRVRRSESGVVQTVKRATVGAVDREEYERETIGEEPDIAWLKTTPLAALFKRDGVANLLEPRFSVDVQRETIPIAFDGARIEAAFDEGAIRAKGLSLPVSELELERVEGHPSAVLDLGRRLARDLPLMPSLATKSERGHGVADLTWGRPIKSISFDLDTAKTIAQAFETIVQSCLHAVLVNTALITGEDDVEAVHKSRVAFRRLRAAVTLFKPVLRRRAFTCVKREIRWASRKLGSARDADVFQGEATQAPSHEGSDALSDVLRVQHRRAYRKLRNAMASARWRLMLIDMLIFSIYGVRNGRRADAYRGFVRRRLRDRRSSLARQSRGLENQDAEAMHDLRKRAKTLRYAIEFFAGEAKLGARKAIRRLQNSLESLQESLGAVHDQDALRGHLHAVLVERKPPKGVPLERWTEAAFAAGQLSAPRADRNGLLRRAGKAARQLRRSTVFA